MPWFPEFGMTYQMAAEGRAAKVTADVMRSYVESVHSGVPAFEAEGIVIHDPRAGRVEGLEAFQEFVQSSSYWLEEREARAEWVTSTATRAGRWESWLRT